MSVRLIDDATIQLSGICPIEDAEPLLQQILAAPQAIVDWRSCTQAHGAVIQVLLAARCRLLGPPSGDFLQAMIQPMMVHDKQLGLDAAEI